MGEGIFVKLLVALVVINIFMTLILLKPFTVSESIQSINTIAKEIDKIKMEVNALQNRETFNKEPNYPLKRYSILYNRAISFLFIMVMINTVVTLWVYGCIVRKIDPKDRILNDIRNEIAMIKEMIFASSDMKGNTETAFLEDMKALMEKIEKSIDQISIPPSNFNGKLMGLPDKPSAILSLKKNLLLWIIIAMPTIYCLHSLYIDYKFKEGVFIKTHDSEIDYANPYLETRLVEAGYKGFNIVRFKYKYYALSQSLGALDLNTTEQKVMEGYHRSGYCFIADTIPEVKLLIDNAEEAKSLKDQTFSGSPFPQLVVEGYKGYNIVKFNNKYYGISHILGPLDITVIEENIWKEYQQNGYCVISDSISAVKRLIDRRENSIK